MSHGQNLNEAKVRIENGQAPQKDHGMEIKLPDLALRVHFRDLTTQLISAIEKADAVVGCVAWLTHEGILQALQKKTCNIIVQKEDFLRPDGSTSAEQLRRHYEKITPLQWHWGRHEVVGATEPTGYSTCGDCFDKYALRCVGNHNKKKLPSVPRMHNKFLVFCRETRRIKEGEEDDEVYIEYTPYAVWTGSFNMTYQGGSSFENAVVITNTMIASQYAKEWAQLLLLSEPLDWDSPWCEPELRVGS